jgi:hypothetical protein
MCQEKNGIFSGKLDRGVDDDLDDGDDEDEVTDNNAIIGGGVGSRMCVCEYVWRM